jgi:hypothetical protein
VVYLLQAEEREIPYELLQGLALILAESPGVVFADAVRKIHVSYGILELGTRAEAERVSARVAGLGLRTFVANHLLEPPEPEPLNPAAAEIAEEVELAAAARVDTTTEHRAMTLQPLRLRYVYPWIPVLDSVIDDKWVRETDAEHYLDLFTAQRHWRAKELSAVPLVEFVRGLGLSTATLGVGVTDLLAGGHNLPRFTSRRDYDRYVTWLYQLRYAER